MRTRALPSQHPGNGIYGLLGRNIPYSLSPAIFRKAFDSRDWPAVYGLFDVEPSRLSRFLAAAADCGVRGFNVTQPYKTRIMSLLDRIDAAAQTIGAVNTVVRRGRSWTGHNTDVHGVHHALLPCAKSLADSNAVIIGAGGAARAVAQVLANRLNVRNVTFAVRSISKGRALVRNLSSRPGRTCLWSVCSLARNSVPERLSEASLLVNTTPLGGHGFIRRSPLPRGVVLPSSLIVFDLVYRPAETRLLRDARRLGCRHLIGGWTMLVAQAEESLYLWTGKRFTPRVRRELRAMERAG